MKRKLMGVVAIAASVAALSGCGGGSDEVDADEQNQSQGDHAEDGQISIGELDADTVEGMCEQAFGSVDDLFANLDLSEDITISEYSEWGDEYFPEESSKPATFRCQASGEYATAEGSESQLQIDISIAAGDSEPRGNTDFTVAADGMTAGMQSYSRDGDNYEYEVVDQPSGEQYLTDDVLTRFKP